VRDAYRVILSSDDLSMLTGLVDQLDINKADTDSHPLPRLSIYDDRGDIASQAKTYCYKYVAGVSEEMCGTFAENVVQKFAGGSRKEVKEESVTKGGEL
jgi:hypothetical protein